MDFENAILSLWVTTGKLENPNDDPPDLGKYSDDSIPQPDPIRDFLEKVKLDQFTKGDASAADPDWNELIADGAPLHKLVDGGDLSKRASSPYKIRLEKTVIDTDDGPETWVFGYDHLGENVYCKVLNASEEKEGQ